MAGGLGGSGFLAGIGTQARLPLKLIGPAFTSQGHLWFTGEQIDVQRIGRVSPDGTLTYRAAQAELPFAVAGVVDAQDRYLVAIPYAGLGPVRVIYALEGDSLQIVAGRVATPTQPDVMQDGKGAAAQICRFESPVLGGDGLVYFLDRPLASAQWTLRTLAPDGMVTSLLPAPNGSRLIVSPTGAVRRFTDAESRVEWAELAKPAPGVYAWNILPSSWPSGSPVPLAPLKGSADKYWGYDAATRTVAHYALDGTRQNARELPGELDVAAANPATGHLALRIRRDLGAPGSWQYPAELYLLDPSQAPAAPLSAWVGQPDQLGHGDGLGDAARFDFTDGTHAVSEGSGPLLVAVGAGTTYGAAAPPVRTVAPSGQVTSTALPYQRTGLLAIAYGHLLTYDRVTSTVLRTPKNGSGSAWEPWVQSSIFAGYQGLQVLRADTTGLLWFATRTLPEGDGSYPAGTGTSLVGTISAAGQVQVLLGDPQRIYSAANYPPLDQRPWFMDITDIAFEGTTSPVSWALCNRTVLGAQGQFERYAPELVRLEGATRQTFALPGLEIHRRDLMPYQQLCVLPSRPGQVFLSSPCGVHRWTVAKGLELVTGQADPTPGGVRLGALPASLNLVKFISPGPDATSLYVGSENSVLRLNLPA